MLFFSNVMYSIIRVIDMYAAFGLS